MNYFDQEMHQSDIEDAQDAIKYCIQGIEDNNSLNGGETSDWENEFEVTNVYLEPLDEEQENRALLLDLMCDETVLEAIKQYIAA